MDGFSTKLWVGVTFVAIVLLLLVGNLASGQTAPPPRNEPIVLNGYLGCGAGNEMPRTCPFRLHYVDFTAGRTYLIGMESFDFGSRLMVEDLHSNMLACNDDWFDALDGSIVFRPSVTGSHRLIANALTPTEGFYTITIRELPVVMNVDAALTSNDPAPNECHERAYDVALLAGRRYIIDMASDEFDAFTKLLNSDGAIVSFANECDRMRNTRMIYTPAETGVYRIVATSFEERATGAFRLIVCEMP